MTALVLWFLWIRLSPLWGALVEQRRRPVLLSWQLSRGSFWRLLGGYATLETLGIIGLGALQSFVGLMPYTLAWILDPIVVAAWIAFTTLVYLVYLGLTFRFFTATRPDVLERFPQYKEKAVTTPKAPAKKPAPKKKLPVKKAKTSKPKSPKS